MARRYVPWFTVIAVALVVIAVPPLRDGARFQWVMLPRHFAPEMRQAETLPSPDPIRDWGNSYRLHCAEFARARYWNDAEMLMAAGMLTPDRFSGLEMLERAAELRSDPVTLSAYVDGLLEKGPGYQTPATLGVDPQQSGRMAEARRSIADRHIPGSLSKSDAAPLLAALARWQKADPKNALPVAVEVWCANGLGNRDKAIARWQEAARMPEMNAHTAQRIIAMRKLLIRMGLPMSEAIIAADSARSFPSLTVLGMSAMLAYYEGSLARMEGRSADALQCWNATVELGERMQECSDRIEEFQSGVNLQAVGGAPAWRWFPDSMTGARGGGIMQGRFFRGPQHEFYQAQAGKQRGQELRDALVLAKTRAMMIERFTGMRSDHQWYTRAGEWLVFGQLATGFLIAAIIVLAAATWARRRTEPSTPALNSPWLLLTSLPSFFVLAAAAGLVVAFSRDCATSPVRMPRGQDVLLGVSLAAVAALAVPLIPALFVRRTGLSLSRAWLDSLRAGLSVAVVVASLIYLGLGLEAADLRDHWVRQNAHPITEMEQARRAIGPSWDHPPVFPGSWVDSHPFR